VRTGAIALVVAAVAGCAGVGAPPPRSFDLGMSVPAARLPAARVAPVRAAPPFDGVEMRYRLAWRDAAELAAFAHSRWAAPPAELLRKQLLRAMDAGSAKCGLEIELQEFSQVFSAPQASEARIELRASLAGPKGRLGARGWSIAEPNAGADAAGGAAAMARAADRAVAEIAAWVAAQADCR
jgi:cholesterol transport system auxiliary component